MTWFMQSKHLAVTVICLCAVTLAASPLAAQQPDSATINGTFIMYPWWGDVGPDLTEIVARDETHTWTLTLHGLSYSHDYELLNYVNPDNYSDRYITRVYATRFDFQFQGPDADALNTIVSAGLVNGGLQDAPFIELRNYTYFDEDWDWLIQAGDWVITIAPIDYLQGFSLVSLPNILEYPWFTVDANGYPVLKPFTCSDAWAFITDRRPGFAGTIGQQGGNTVSIVSVVPPLPGDYNHDGAVNAADYVAWRKSPNSFGGDPGGYNNWRTSFGQPTSGEAGMGTAANITVPEPCGLVLLFPAVPALLRRRNCSRI